MTMTILVALGWTLFVLVIIAGLLLDLVGLFGNWLILGAAAAVWLISRFEIFGVWLLLFLLVMAVAGEIIEAVASGYGASRYGGGKGAMVAAVVGCIVGAILGTPWMPLIGTLLGACLGAFIGATAYELAVVRKDLNTSMRTGFGAALGKVAGMLGKLFVGVLMVLAIVVSLFQTL
jgi:hypothetical protein